MEKSRYPPHELSTNVHYVHIENSFVPWATLKKPLSETKVALVTTAGLHLPSQSPFADEENRGDFTFRELPRTVRTGDCHIAHTHYEHKWVLEDINCLLPVEVFTELETEGVIGELAETHYSFMGSIPNPIRLIVDTAPEVAQRMRDNEVDLSVLNST